MVAKGTHDDGWSRLFLTSGKDHVVYQLSIKPYLHYPQANDCKGYSNDALVACQFRASVIRPVLVNSAIDPYVDDGINVCSEWYLETIELILMFLQGRPTLVLRPLPAIANLVQHGFLKVHPRFMERWKRRLDSVGA